MAYVIKKPSSRLGAAQVVALSTTSAASTTVGSETFQVQLVATAAAYITIGNSPTATTTASTLIPANFPLVYTITPGQAVAGILTASTATLSVTELT
jgi:hypothetical protein